MRIVGIALLLLCMAATAWAEEMTLLQQVVPYENNSLRYQPQGLPETIVTVNVQPVQNSDWVYVKLETEQHGPAIIIFDSNGKMLSRVRNFNVENSQYVSLAPTGDVLALDSGTDHNRTWTFMALPDYRPMGKPVNYTQTLEDGRNDLVWLNETYVLVPILKQPKEREIKCGSRQICGNHSINLYNVRNHTLMPLFQGTDLCDYYYTGFEHPVIFGEKICVKAIEDWNSPEKQTTTTRVMGALPESYQPDKGRL